LLTGSPDDSLLATALSNRVIQDNYKAPKIATMVLNADSVGASQGGNLRLGSIVNLITKESVDIDGYPTPELYQVMKISGNGFENYRVKMRKYQALTPASVDFVISSSAVNLNLSAVYTPPPGHYVIYISPDVVIGSYNPSIPALTTGAQTSGVSFTIINRGQLLSPGGAGGNCGLISTAPTNGLDGGIVFDATVNCTIDNGSGLIWAGGGGGGAEKTYAVAPGPLFPVYVRARGGSGGQGFGSSGGGDYTNGANGTSLPVNDGTELWGNQASYGSSGIHGGSWGESGSNGSTSIRSSPGLAGIAIKSNGNTVTISSGNNDFNIRGRRT
jgi:hypothetical protein